jgi:hypothetical protein
VFRRGRSGSVISLGMVLFPARPKQRKPQLGGVLEIVNSQDFAGTDRSESPAPRIARLPRQQDLEEVFKEQGWIPLTGLW